MRIERVVDLSRPISPDMQVYPGDPQPRVRQIADVGAEGFALHELVLGSQTGTHFDAPCHVLDGGEHSGEVGLDRFVAPARVVDCSMLGSSALIDAALLAPSLRGLPTRTAVLIRTGWDRHDGQDAAWDHPGLDSGAAQLLVERDVSFVGIDAASIDLHSDASLPSHRVLARAGIPIIENLRRLELVDWSNVLVVAAPLSWSGLDGAPLRAMAIKIAL